MSVCMSVCSIVSESGASIYSASEAAQRELSNYDVCMSVCMSVCSIVSESGASIYSASEAAQRELSNYDVSLRGAGNKSTSSLCPVCHSVAVMTTVTHVCITY